MKGWTSQKTSTAYLDAAGEGVLLGAGLGAGDGERLRPRLEDGEAGRCPPGDVNCLSFCGSTDMGQKWRSNSWRSLKEDHVTWNLQVILTNIFTYCKMLI